MFMTAPVKRVLIISDIEGSSGCWSYQGSRFMTREWAGACREMTLDAAAVVKALFKAGVEKVLIKDFHRTAYNILPEYIDPRARVVHGYRAGPVAGLGDPEDVQGVMFLGLHAASGTKGFLSHTLTSRIAQLTIGGRPLSEVELFSASLASHGVRPLFFSGCEHACLQAADRIPGMMTYPLDKTGSPDRVNVKAWREGLADAAVRALFNEETLPFTPQGPFTATMTMRDGESAARKTGRKWGLETFGNDIRIQAPDLPSLFVQLSKFVYLTPFLYGVLPFSLFLYRLLGRAGLIWVRARVKKGDLDV